MQAAALHGRDVTRRRAALALLAAGALAAARSRAAGAGPVATLPAPGSLASALALALRAGHPLLVMASAEGCPYCRVVREHYLLPLRREEGVPVVQLDLGSRAGLADFDAAPATHDELLRRWGVQVAPTVLFFGRGGREAAPRLVGLAPDFYGGYLEQRLSAARRRLG